MTLAHYEGTEVRLDTWAGATFSSCGTFRYVLWRRFMYASPRRPWLVVIMLNPSTADAWKNDPTVRRCIARAMSGEYLGVIVLNVFALRSTDPKALYSAADPIGPDNDAFIKRVLSMIEDARDPLDPKPTVVVAWGTHGDLKNRDRDVMAILRAHHPRSVYSIGPLTKDGFPRHPLYLRSTLPLIAYEGRPA
jgi:hypothetical protein